MCKKEKINKCHKCGKELEKIKTNIRVRAEISRLDDPYDGPYKHMYFNYCPCWKDKTIS